MPTARIPEEQPISATEKQILEKFQKEIGQQLEEHHISEGTQLRFIRGFKDDPKPADKAAEMLRNMLAWRQKEKVDEWGMVTLPREQEFRSKYWISGLHGMSKDGHPLYFEKLGSIDPAALTKNFSVEEVVKFHIQLMEKVTEFKDELSASSGRRVYKHIAILDLKGVGMGHVGKKFTEPMKGVIHIDQFYYPETLKLMFITNASWIIKTVWKLVSPWIDPITKENIKFGSAELANYVDPDQLPRFLGGTCRCQECLVTPFIPGEGAKQPDIAKQISQTPRNRTKSNASLGGSNPESPIHTSQPSMNGVTVTTVPQHQLNGTTRA